MATKKSIADQVLLRISKGYHDSSSAVQIPDVILAVGQVLNSMLKQQFFAQTLQSGDTIPDGTCLTSYYNIPVISQNGKSSASLPILPIYLPKGLGVYEVLASQGQNINDGNVSFIPCLPGQINMLKGQDIICDLLGNIGYEQIGQTLIFNKDITIDGINKVDVKLAVADINQLTEYSPLPVDAGLEAEIVEKLVQMFAPSQTNDDEVDSLSQLKDEGKK